MQTSQDSLELCNLELQLLSDFGIEFVGIYTIAVMNAVTEFRIDQFDAELFHQQQDVVINRGDTGGNGNVEGN